MTDKTYNDYHYVLILKTENDDGTDTAREVRLSEEQVKIILTNKQQAFLKHMGWVTINHNIIEYRTYSINELHKKFPTLEISKV